MNVPSFLRHGRKSHEKASRWISQSLRVLTLFVFIIPFNLIEPGRFLQTDSPRGRAQQMLENLTPEERVGQLFLVTFNGTEAEIGSQIQELIANYHVGGVLLLADHDNFSSDVDILERSLNLNRQLQLNRWAAAQQPDENSSGESFTPAFIPLFIAIAQEGDGYPFDQILSGLTQLPNQMALGATWNPDLVNQVGSIAGKELEALGVNLLIGPSLDVLEQPQRVGGSGLGTRTFGGDPFWVGKLGQALIRGIHNGSGGRIAVVAKHFPGNGGADRLPEEEVATVRKSLDQLQNYDLAPFFDVTGNAPSQEEAADALLTSHIRYQGFQGNIRATTRPVSFDQQAFSLLMSLPALASWRDNGGLMVSDNLGSSAIRKFFELTNPNEPFDPSRVALNAFMAGNDLLNLGNMSSGEEIDTYTATINILSFFAQKYRDDPAFAERVDASVLRILTLKFRLYGEFNLNQVLPDENDLADLGKANQVTFEVARQAATLISPSLAELDEELPDPPNRNQRIVFITDVRTSRQCSLCPDQPVMAADALQQAVIRLYGPEAGRLVTPWFLISYTYEDLVKLLNGEEGTFQFQRDISRADWIVFAMLSVDDGNPVSQALHRFLAERPNFFQQKRLIVFSFNAPTYLDATNISKLTAYYGLYSKTPIFIDVAARLLFRELRPVGSLPISVPAVGYDLITATMPNPDQIIPLSLDLLNTSPGEAGTPVPEPATGYRVNQSIPVISGTILDHNGHPVPDGTPVQFITTYNGEVSGLPQSETTKNGIAQTIIQITNTGLMEIKVESEPAKQSVVLRFEIPLENDGMTPTATVAPTETPTPSPSPPPLPTVDSQAGARADVRPYLQDWLMAILLSVVTSLGTYRLSAYIGQVRWGVRGAFLALTGGLVAYSYIAIGLPGSQNLLDSSGSLGIIMITLLGCATGILFTWTWRYLTARSRLGN